MKLLKYEGYKVTIAPEALALAPFKKIWNRDRTLNKDRAISEISYVYFMVDPRSDYQYLIDEEERSKAIIEGEGLPANWKPDKLIQEAMDFYGSMKPQASLLLEDTRLMVDKYRKKLRGLNFDELEVKDLKDMGALIKGIPDLVKALDEAERAVNAEMRNSGRMRGSGEKTIMEDSLDI